MIKQYHILNGDCLKGQFPEKIKGEQIIARECLVDGPVKADNLEELYKTRAEFISEYDIEFSAEEYYMRSVSEFEKIQRIGADSAIYLWFEDDLFCQINLWFMCSLIHENYSNQSVYFIRPKIDCAYYFGSMTEEELISQYQNKVIIKGFELEQFSKLWRCYQNDNFIEMKEIAQKLYEKFPFLMDAVNAHVDRFSNNGRLGRPARTLLQIREELKTNDFTPIFKEFTKREAIYGFGDLQVKRLMENLKIISK